LRFPAPPNDGAVSTSKARTSRRTRAAPRRSGASTPACWRRRA